MIKNSYKPPYPPLNPIPPDERPITHNEERIWVCEECNQIFNSEETVKDCKCTEVSHNWGHKCKAHPRSKKPWRCESYLQEYFSK